VNYSGECIDCLLANEVISQNVFDVQITKDLRKYRVPIGDSLASNNIYKRRTAVKRMNVSLKEVF